MQTVILLALATVVNLQPAPARVQAVQDPPVKVFILAGQSNMEGQAVVDLKGVDYNEGKGTLQALLDDPSKKAMVAHLRQSDGSWTVRNDVWVRYQRENAPLLMGPLGLGFSVYGDQHHFGPELQFGHVIGNQVSNPVLLIKAAWGGKSLYQDFRPPSSGGQVGKFYTLMVKEVREALANMGSEFPALKGKRYELAGTAFSVIVPAIVSFPGIFNNTSAKVL